MANTFSQIYIQIVFAVSGRQSLIKPEFKEDLFKYVTGIIRNQGQKLIPINGMADHVHMLIQLSPTIAPSDALRFIKANSSKWVRDKWPRRVSFAWQLGYGAFSVSKSSIPAVLDYIHNQEQHHRKVTFQEEFIDFLKRHEIEYDERYIWK